MASKGQKFKKYSSKLREEILKKYWNGETASDLASEYDVPANKFTCGITTSNIFVLGRNEVDQNREN